jgi:hypothetical protein
VVLDYNITKKMMEEIDHEEKNEANAPVQEEEKTLEDHEKSEILKKVELYIQGSTSGGAVGSHKRLVLTKTTADMCLILFCVFDLPLRKPIIGFRTLKYLSWLSQCIITIVYQLIELNYVIKDSNFLVSYLANNRCDADLYRRILRRLRELKKNYRLRLCSLARHMLDIPMVLRFIGISYIPAKVASMIGTLTSAISLYSLIKLE